MTRRTILVVTDDALGSRMAGPAIRAWHIAEVLSAEHDVRLASTTAADGSSPSFAVCDGAEGRLRDLADGMDVILLQGFTLYAHPWLAELGAHLVIDLYDPIHLEVLEGAAGPAPTRQRELSMSLDALRIVMEHGDFFLCASERQRDLWLGHLSAFGRVNFATYAQDPTVRALIDVAPFGIDARPPQVGSPAIRGVIDGIGPDDQVLLWAGGVYNWFDPITLIEAVHELSAGRPRLRLVFLGTKHPSLQDLSTTVLQLAIDRAAELGLLDTHVFFLPGWVPYAQRGAYLTDADIGVSAHLLHVETAFSFRTRMLDYLWAGLPIVCTEGDEFAGIVARAGVGRVVAAGDRDGWVQALRELLDAPQVRARCGQAAREAARPFYWRQALAPLVEYCRDPRRAPDHDPARRPVGRLTRWGSRLDDRWSRVRSMSPRVLAVRIVRAPVRRAVLLVLRVLPAGVKQHLRELPAGNRARLHRFFG